ncbi:MAG: twitching motility protein PilT [Verrucomicrobia bacterium]|nr:MAG: twitching motility protein PilT [Verrucomicrobiota bacterium]
MNVALSANAFTVRFYFHGSLSFFLRREDRAEPITKYLREKTSVKDAIESCGVPHPEVDLICCDGQAVPFEHCLIADAIVDVHGVIDSPAKPGEGLQERSVTRFVADGHLGKLARDLRLLGFDVVYAPAASDSSLAASCSDDRALLTRDRRLLMHKIVRHGYCPRSQDPTEQILEVIRRFDLAKMIAPYTRCLQCNGLLAHANKMDVIEQLQPLTKIYYQDFRRCPGCGKIYWSGSHFGKLEARIERIRKALTT